MKATNETSSIVVEYSQRKMLATLGYTFSSDALTQFDVDCFSIIANEFASLEEQEMKLKSKRKR